MKDIKKVKSISIWIFLIPFLALNICLILITQFHSIFPNQEDVLLNTIPYIDGGASISRTARVFPTYLVFKPAMFLTSYLLIKYWIYNKNIILNFDQKNKYVNKIVFFGIGSAILLTIHSIFLGIKFDYDLYKLFRRVVMLLFIIFEIVAQAYLVFSLYKIKDKLERIINFNYLKLKRILVTTLIIIAILSIPIVSQSGYKHFKHALEWDYFLGVISFYLLTFMMWKKK
ncbi:MAG: hypothetical protein CBD99_003705 [Candidatus Pelagibacter sp. TMED239]|nr:MAG: hypothetical protein CBD99_003705 [Candidatus Pelagibacter sp. TMED239]|tara:strand:+ start:4610 stop:5296 length:687 start_codon:yes stop_codon:yes gene_type:complete